MSGENENNAETCYKGQLPAQWAQHVEALNHLFREVYPLILDKNAAGAYKGVKQNYPEIEDFNNEDLAPGKAAMDFMEALPAEDIDVTKASRDEKGALDIFTSTKRFMKIIRNYSFFGKFLSWSQVAKKKCHLT